MGKIFSVRPRRTRTDTPCDR